MTFKIGMTVMAVFSYIGYGWLVWTVYLYTRGLPQSIFEPWLLPLPHMVVCAVGGLLTGLRCRRAGDDRLASAAWGAFSALSSVLILLPLVVIISVNAEAALESAWRASAVMLILTVPISLWLVPRWLLGMRSKDAKLRELGIKNSELELALAVVLLAVLFEASIALAGHSTIASNNRKPSLTEISRVTHLVFPDGSRLCGSWRQRFMHDSVFACVEISRSDVHGFLHQLPSDTEFSRQKKPFEDDYADVDWWKPSSAHKFVSAQYLHGGSGGTMLQVLVSLDDPKRAKVYLWWCRD